MPDPNHKIRCFASALLLALTSATLAACSGGDFGRTREDMRSDDMHRWLGAEVTSSVGLKPSQFQLTEEERQLRDLAYPMIEPPLSRPAWRSVFGDYKAMPSPCPAQTSPRNSLPMLAPTMLPRLWLVNRGARAGSS